jgi:hypothetical protein
MPTGANLLYARGLISDAQMDRLRDTMTHQAPQPNPARPIIDAGRAFWNRGLQGLADQQGWATPKWSQTLGKTLSSPAANIALGMTAPLKGRTMEAPPKELFHVTGDDYRAGQPIKSLYRQYGDEAYDKYAERWPEAGDMGQYHAHQNFFYESLPEAQEHVDEFGGKILKIDPSKIDGLRRDNLEIGYGKDAGFWTTREDVPPEAISPVK